MSGAAPPPEWRLELDPGLRRHDGDRVLVGGHPPRVLRLTAAGAASVTEWAGGGPVGSSPAAGRLAARLVRAGMAHPLPPEGAGRSLGFALVVPTRDRPDGLAALLASALHPGFADPGTVPVPGRVVVVDDGSADPEAVAAVAARFGAELVRHDHSRGPAAARNRGWRAATEPVVAFLDDDCRCPGGPGWAAPLLDHLADPAVALAAPRVRARRGRAPAWLGAYESRRSPLDLGPRPGPIRPGSPVPYVPAAALVVRRSALEESGGFDEGLAVGEDVDLEWRLAGAGWSLRYEPGSVVAHEVRNGLPAWAAQRFRYGTSAVALEARWPHAVAPVRLSPWTAVAWGLAATTSPVGLVAGAGVAAASTATLVRRLNALPRPARTALRLSGLGHWWAGAALARALRREWWPLLALALVTRRGRRLGLAVAAVAAADHRGRSPGPAVRPRRLLLALADDVAYGSGVWAAALRRGRLRALLPALGDGPVVDRRGGRGQPAATGGPASSDPVVDVGAPTHHPA